MPINGTTGKVRMHSAVVGSVMLLKPASMNSSVTGRTEQRNSRSPKTLFFPTAAASASSRWSIWWTGGLLAPLPVAVLEACSLLSSPGCSRCHGCLQTTALGNLLRCVNSQITWGWMRAWCLITTDRLLCLRPCLMHSAARQCSGQIFVRSLYKSLELFRSELLGSCAYTCLAPPSFCTRLEATDISARCSTDASAFAGGWSCSVLLDGIGGWNDLRRPMPALVPLLLTMDWPPCLR